MKSSDPAISILIVEDDAALRRDFVAMVDAAPGIELLDTAASLASARAALAARGAPDVLVIDLGLPDGDGAVLIRELSVSAPSTSALVITVFGDEDHVVRALEAGARGYLLKDATLDEFVRAVRLVQDGGSPLSPSIARHVLNRFRGSNGKSSAPPPVASARTVESLTPRETEILQLIARGSSIGETAAALCLSPHTVTTHVKRIYGKLAVNNRVQAVNRARAIGTIS
jgi:DNA-binding NarL/FixJ family response regulator